MITKNEGLTMQKMRVYLYPKWGVYIYRNIIYRNI